MRPWVGVAVQPMTSEMAESLGLSAPQGVLVTAVAKDSPADKAELKSGDVIIAIGGVDIASEQELKYRVALAKLGDESEFKILRQGKPDTLKSKWKARRKIPSATCAL